MAAGDGGVGGFLLHPDFFKHQTPLWEMQLALISVVVDTDDVTLY